MRRLKLLEQYDALVECTPEQMSFAWKASLVLSYMLGASSSYACSVLFHTFWHDVCGGHCFFWARVDWKPPRNFPIGTIDNEFSGNSSLQLIPRAMSNSGSGVSDPKSDYVWYEDAFLHFQHGMRHCGWFHLSCLISCYVAATLLMLFSISGRGGYDTSRFVASWRVVVPALMTSLVMMIMTMAATHVLTQGYLGFSQSMIDTASKVNGTVDYTLKSYEACEVFKSFTWKHNTQNRDACAIHAMIGWTSWLMVWSWIIAFISLTLRILVTADFILLKVKIYEMPANEMEREVILEKIRQGRISIGFPSSFPSFALLPKSDTATLQDSEKKRERGISETQEEKLIQTNTRDVEGEIDTEGDPGVEGVKDKKRK